MHIPTILLKPFKPSMRLYEFVNPVIANMVNIMDTQGNVKSESNNVISTALIKILKKYIASPVENEIAVRRNLIETFFVKSSISPVMNAGNAQKVKLTSKSYSFSVLDALIAAITARVIYIPRPPILGVEFR